MGFLVVASAVMAGIQVASGIEQYSQQKKADSAARNAANQQATLVEQNAAVQSQKELANADQARKTQLMDYLSSGVTTAGSPLLVMEDTRAKGVQNAKNITDNADAQANLLRQQGSVGRASLLGSLSGVGSNLASDYSNYSTINKNTMNSSSSALPWQSSGNVNPLGGTY